VVNKRIYIRITLLQSCVLLYWQCYCTALQQRASAKLCDVVQGMELRNFHRERHPYSAGRPSCLASTHILVPFITPCLRSCTQQSDILVSISVDLTTLFVVFSLLLPVRTASLLNCRKQQYEYSRRRGFARQSDRAHRSKRRMVEIRRIGIRNGSLIYSRREYAHIPPRQITPRVAQMTPVITAKRKVGVLTAAVPLEFTATLKRPRLCRFWSPQHKRFRSVYAAAECIY